MSYESKWKLGRLAKIGLSAAVLPTLMVGLVAFERTDTGPATTGTELVKHLSDENRNKPDDNTVNGGKNKDVDKKEDKKNDDPDFDNPVNGGPNKPDVDKKERNPSGVPDKPGPDSKKNQPDNDK